MKIVRVIRRIPVNEKPVFEVRTDGKLEGCFCFELNAPADDPYHEETNRLKAMELALKIEKGNQDIEEIIYQTPNE